MRLLPSGRIHQRQRVGGELLNGESFANGQATAKAAVIEAEAKVVRREFPQLRLPSIALYTYALDEKNRRAITRKAIVQAAALMLVFRHGVYMK